MVIIIKGIIRDIVLFFLWYGPLTFIVFEISDRLPNSVDATGLGMLAVIIMGAGFMLGSFRMGASYSLKLEEQDPGPLINFLKRPIRSIFFGALAIVLSFGLLYLVICVSDWIG